VPDGLRLAIDHFEDGAEIERGADVQREVTFAALDAVHDGLLALAERSVSGVPDHADDFVTHQFVAVGRLEYFADGVFFSEISTRQRLINDGGARTLVGILISKIFLSGAVVDDRGRRAGMFVIAVALLKTSFGGLALPAAVSYPHSTT